MKQTQLEKFNELVAIEPRLGELLNEAKLKKTKWYGSHTHPGLKSKFTKLVGFCAENRDDRLTSCEAYALAYEILCKACKV